MEGGDELNIEDQKEVVQGFQGKEVHEEEGGHQEKRKVRN